MYLPSLAFSQEQQILLLPSDHLKNTLNKLQNKNKLAGEITEDPSSGNINQEVINSNLTSGSAASLKSIADMVNHISSAQVEHFGGEAGLLKLRLRGARAFEPSYYFNGLPLTGAGSSEQNLNLLPVSYIGSLNIYPDSPPFWLSSHGIGGDVDILPCTRLSCFSLENTDKQNLFKITSRLGAFQYKQFNANYSLKQNTSDEVFFTANTTKSKEDYFVLNNNNSVLHSDEGTFERLQNNDFHNVSFAGGGSKYIDHFGKVTLHAVFGNEERGISAPIGTFSSERLKRNIFLATVKSESFFPRNGFKLFSQLGGFYNTSNVSNLGESISSQTTQSQSYTLQAKGWGILPTELLTQEQLGFSFEILHTAQSLNSDSKNVDTSSTHNNLVQTMRTEYRPSLFTSILFPISYNFTLSANGQGFVSFISETQDSHNTLGGYSLSIQSKYYSLVNYIRYVQSTRRPFLTEFYGAPGGVLANNKLQSEKSEKIEFGLNFPYGDAGLFYAKDQNLIFLQQIGPVSSQYQNIESGHRSGLYVSSNYNYKNLELFISYQYTNAKMTRNGETASIPRSPKHYITASSSLTKIPFCFSENFAGFFGAYINMNYESYFYLDYANISKMQVSPLYNSGFSFSIPFNKLAQIMTVSFDIYNVSNEVFSTLTATNGTIQQVQSNGYLGYPPPGRRFYMSLTGEF